MAAKMQNPMWSCIMQIHKIDNKISKAINLTWRIYVQDALKKYDKTYQVEHEKPTELQSTIRPAGFNKTCIKIVLQENKR